MNVEERLWHWSTCEGRASTLKREGDCLSNCRQRITWQVKGIYMCRLLQYSLYNAREAAQNWEEELFVDTQRSQADERDRVPMSVWQGCIKGELFVATVHGDDTTIGGERMAVEFFN